MRCGRVRGEENPQWVSTKGGAPSLVFWDTGSQVTLVTHKVARAMGLPASPGSPLRLEGIGDGHRPKAATRFKVALVDTCGRVITMTAYRVDNIMSPLGGGDITLMREAFPEVPTGGLVPAVGEVSLLMGQDNLSLFPTERRRVGNAALYMSGLGPGGLHRANHRGLEAAGTADMWEYASSRLPVGKRLPGRSPIRKIPRSAHCQQCPSGGQPHPCTSKGASSNLQLPDS
jgi:hypothetical protein